MVHTALELNKLKVAELKKKAANLNVIGTGKNGRVLKRDYVAALLGKTSVGSPGSTLRISATSPLRSSMYTAEELNKLKVAELKKKAGNLNVIGTGKNGRVLKKDYIAALLGKTSIGSPKSMLQISSRSSGYTAEELNKLKVAQLKKKAGNLNVIGTGKNGRVLKKDYIAALLGKTSIGSPKSMLQISSRSLRISEPSEYLCGESYETRKCNKFCNTENGDCYEDPANVIKMVQDNDMFVDKGLFGDKKNVLKTLKQWNTEFPENLPHAPFRGKPEVVQQLNILENLGILGELSRRQILNILQRNDKTITAKDVSTATYSYRPPKSLPVQAPKSLSVESSDNGLSDLLTVSGSEKSFGSPVLGTHTGSSTFETAKSSFVKSRCTDTVNPLVCSEDEICMDTGKCVDNTASARNGMYTLLIGDRSILGTKQNLEKLQSTLGGILKPPSDYEDLIGTEEDNDLVNTFESSLANFDKRSSDKDYNLEDKLRKRLAENKKRFGKGKTIGLGLKPAPKDPSYKFNAASQDIADTFASCLAKFA